MTSNKVIKQQQQTTLINMQDALQASHAQALQHCCICTSWSQQNHNQ
jgi:hypothetical protein